MLFGGTVNIKNELGFTPLHEAVEMGSRTMVEELIKNGAILSTKDAMGRTARKLAKKRKNKSLKKYLRREEKKQK